VTGARHVEVQVIADGQGTAWAIGVRDCTVQRRNQKVIEESASPLLSDEQTDELRAAAERLALAVDYRGAGTVEFLYHPGSRQFAFLEVNTRLQVEHPITEETTDVDLVRAQLHVAAGGRLEGPRPQERGHAVEARLNAEDPDRDFAPSPGRIALLELPTGPGVRVDTGVGEGDTIPADFDSMIAKIIAHGRDREEALARLRRAVGETTVVIEGGATNKSFVLELLAQPEVVGPDGGAAAEPPAGGPGVELGGLGAQPPAGGHGGGAPVWAEPGGGGGGAGGARGGGREGGGGGGGPRWGRGPAGGWAVRGEPGGRSPPCGRTPGGSTGSVVRGGWSTTGTPVWRWWSPASTPTTTSARSRSL